MGTLRLPLQCESVSVSKPLLKWIGRDLLGTCPEWNL